MPIQPITPMPRPSLSLSLNKIDNVAHVYLIKEEEVKYELLSLIAALNVTTTIFFLIRVSRFCMAQALSIEGVQAQ